ncbi:hypothetical protein RSSM_03386 [Rhodopirellula sallentina SM41]|uniref:Uncharacterized protein n=1 Tax=Rhodopirellula sallentina SM41 TaxID=1263870 RepID=M5UBF4_9BACT|nr:hypothetical protein RSSM_03386 [Rhodopirellula sallentina SM41]
MQSCRGDRGAPADPQSVENVSQEKALRSLKIVLRFEGMDTGKE